MFFVVVNMVPMVRENQGKSGKYQRIKEGQGILHSKVRETQRVSESQGI